MRFLKQKRYRQLAGIFFLVTSATWLFGPSLNHYLLAGPNLISEYESRGMPFALLFRLFDLVAALILLLTVRANMPSLKKRWGEYVPVALTVLALLMAMDFLLPLHCTVVRGICVPNTGFLATLHGIESYSIAALTFGVSAYLMHKYKYGRWFVWVQIACFILGIVAHTYDNHWLFAIQASYQIFQAFWLYQIVFLTEVPALPPSRATYLRYLISVWIGLNGVVAILSALHRFQLGRAGEFAGPLLFADNPAWQLSHAILLGLLLMYFARQLWQGDRRAGVLTALLLFVQILSVSTTSKGWFYIPLFSLPLIALIYYREIFDKRGNFVGFTSRLRFIAAGVIAIAICITLVLSVIRARQHDDWRRSPIDVGLVLRRAAMLETTPQPNDTVREKFIDNTVVFLAAGIYAWIIIGIFLPKSSFHNQSHAEREELLGLLKNHSNSSEDYFKYWPKDKFYYRTKAGLMIAYAQSSTVIIALADPIGDPRFRTEGVKEFTQYCRELGYKSAWLLVSEESKSVYESAGRKLLQIGSAAEVDIADFANKTIRNKWWRWQMNRAGRAGYSYKLHTAPHSPALLKATKKVSDTWLTRDSHREQSFAMGYFNEAYLQECRLHCLYDAKGKLIAFTNEVPIFAGNQTTVDMIRFLPGNDGAMQTLLAQAIQQLAEEGVYESFDLGFVPLAEVGTVAAKIIKQFSGQRFSSAGLAQFKNKFAPKWKPYYLAYDGDTLDLAKIFRGLTKVLGVTVTAAETETDKKPRG